MLKKIGLLLFSAAIFQAATAQDKNDLDSLPDYDVLFNDLAHFIDSITAPRSFTTVNAGLSTGHFEYLSGQNTIKDKRRFIITPSAGYYHKSGLGISAVGSVMAEQTGVTLYQTAATASYDYLKNRKLMTGFSYTHFFTKDSLPFYTSPLNDQVSAYFTYRGWWLKPAVVAIYGWGNTSSVEKRKYIIRVIDYKKKRPHPIGPPIDSTVVTKTDEAITDISLIGSVKHDFYWLNVASKRDYVRLTPQLAVRGGTQRYGLAQTNNSYISDKNSSTTITYDTEKTFISARSQIQILSVSARIRAEYSRGIFFVQPQLMFDYFVPDKENKLATAFVINAGILF